MKPTEEQTMITLFGKAPKSMNRTEIRRELKVQKALLRIIKRSVAVAKYKHEQQGFNMEEAQKELRDVQWLFDSWQIDLKEFRKRNRTLNAAIARAVSREDSIEFYEKIILNLEALIASLEYYKDRRTEAPKEYESAQVRYNRKAEKKKRQALINADKKKAVKWDKMIERSGINLSWDKDKFMLVAKDRGYQTYDAILLAVQNELNLDRSRADNLIRKGKYTWGQVLCMGALFEMTPKEFCDIFLSGYFVEYYGEYRASYANINKDNLLRRATLPAVEKHEDIDQQEG